MTRILPAVLALAVLTSARGHAQDVLVFRSDVAAVTVDVSVHQRGRVVAALTAGDFELQDNGVVQTLEFVGRQLRPVDLTLIVDLSGSVDGLLLDSLHRAIDVVARSLRADDRVRLVTFSQRIRPVHDFESGRPSVRALRLGTPGGFTSVFDAIAVSLAGPTEPERRQMAIVFTDGQDTTSYLDAATVLELAAHSEATVSVVALTTRGVEGAQAIPDERFFRALSQATGGVLTVVHRNEPLAGSFMRAVNEFRTSYALRYTLAGTPRAGYHDITVRITRPGEFDVRARRGYFSNFSE
jgi:VWFA-related protein